jgi:DNA-binding MarR family transcriptional regulator
MSSDIRRQLIEEVQLSLRALHSAVDTVNQAVADHLGINRTDLRCVEIVARQGPLTAGQLAAASGLTSGAVTTVIDRIEEAGFVRRVRDRTDRRRVRVELIPAAGLRLHALYRDLLAASAENLERYTDDELHMIGDFVRRGRDITAEHADRIASLARAASLPAQPATNGPRRARAGEQASS